MADEKQTEIKTGMNEDPPNVGTKDIREPVQRLYEQASALSETLDRVEQNLKEAGAGEKSGDGCGPRGP